ncbi:MAG: hypothetical protein HGA97_00975 [Chlorobiaceae bacterium]|nr:hypothetical protein [Chlorobiaceae bacterium]
MTITVPFNAIRGHIIVPMPTGNALVDTGSPTSFAPAPFDFAGNRYAPPTDMAGVTTDTLSELADIKIEALIGCDILAGLHAMRIRWNEGILEFADDFPDGETVDKMETLGGIPVFPVRLGDVATMAIFDTGAHLSYIDPKLVSAMTPIGQKEDFHPLNGRFTAPVFSVNTTLAGHDHDLEYGILPGALEVMTAMARALTGSSAVIGTAILEHFDVTISWRQDTISWCHA